MTEIPEALYAQARVTLAYALTKQKEGDVEGAVEVIARGMMKPVNEWRPIETAPKDAAILAWAPNMIAKVKWGPLYLAHQVNGKAVEMHGFVLDGSMNAEVRPTYWMPLPTPPEAP